MQEQQNCFHKAWNVDIEIVSNGTKKIRFVSPFRKKLCFDIVIFRLGGKNCIVKNEKWIVFCESRYVNSNPAWKIWKQCNCSCKTLGAGLLQKDKDKIAKQKQKYLTDPFNLTLGNSHREMLIMRLNCPFCPKRRWSFKALVANCFYRKIAECFSSQKDGRVLYYFVRGCGT